jgi:hypothetical protein
LKWFANVHTKLQKIQFTNADYILLKIAKHESLRKLCVDKREESVVISFFHPEAKALLIHATITFAHYSKKMRVYKHMYGENV